MKQIFSDKYSVAWFKLAECISKRERERAMGIYRLLVHSIDNHAFSKQLEADMHLFFEDYQAAFAKYKEAAHLYYTEKKLSLAIAVYEHFLSLPFEQLSYLPQLVAWYHQSNQKEKLKMHGAQLVKLLVGKQESAQAQEVLISVISATGCSDELTPLAFQLLELQKKNNKTEQEVAPLLAVIMADLITRDTQVLSQFLTECDARIPEYAQLAQSLLKK